MNRDAEVRGILKASGAVLTDDHFVYTSGKHGSSYINKDAVYLDPNNVWRLAEMIAIEFQESPIDVVVGPAVGAVVLGAFVALHMQKLRGELVQSVYADKDTDKKFVLKRGYDRVVSGKNVLVVEDNITTGGSVSEVIRLVEEHKGIVMGVGALCNRGNVTAKDIGTTAKFISLLEMPMDMWDADTCPLCAKGVRINMLVGKGAEFIRHRDKH